MGPLYIEKILKEINELPADMLPHVYKSVHSLKSVWLQNRIKSDSRGSLYGIWKGSEIDDCLFD